MRYQKLLHEVQDNISKSTAEDTELIEYQQDFLEMNIGSLQAIARKAQSILDSMDDPSVKKNLTASWLQGKIAITEDYMTTIHDFVKYVPSDDDKTIAGCGCGGNKKQNGQTQKHEPVDPTKQMQNRPVKRNTQINQKNKNN